MSKIKPSRNGTKKEVITLKAAALFRKKGFNAGSMRHLAEAVGVEAPSLYNHIGSKNELLNEICLATAEEYNRHLSEVEQAEGTCTEKLREVISFHIKMMLNKYDQVFVVNHEWKQLREPFLGNFISIRKNYEARLIALIANGVQNKEFINNDPYVIMLTILSAVRGLEIWQRHKNNIKQDVLEKQMIRHLLNGIIK